MTIDRSSSPRRGCSGCSGCRDGAGFPLATRAAFHPIIDLHRERVFAYEALIRGEAGEGAAFVLDQSGGGADVRLRPGLPGHRDPRRGRGRDRGNRAKLSINFLPNAVYSPMACIS